MEPQAAQKKPFRKRRGFFSSSSPRQQTPAGLCLSAITGCYILPKLNESSTKLGRTGASRFRPAHWRIGCRDPLRGPSVLKHHAAPSCVRWCRASRKGLRAPFSLRAARMACPSSQIPPAPLVYLTSGASRGIKFLTRPPEKCLAELLSGKRNLHQRCGNAGLLVFCVPRGFFLLH